MLTLLFQTSVFHICKNSNFASVFAAVVNLPSALILFSSELVLVSVALALYNSCSLSYRASLVL